MKNEVSHFSDGSSDENKNLIYDEERRQQSLALDNEIEHNEQIITEREEGILEIEATINQVNEIFKDLHIMVKEQGEVVDTIENNITGVETLTDGANSELKEANTSQKKARNKKCIILLIFMVILVILIIVIVVKVGFPNTTPSPTPAPTDAPTLVPTPAPTGGLIL